MKAEELVKRQFDEAKVAWGAEKNALQARILDLEGKVISTALEARKDAPDNAVLEARLVELTTENAELKAAAAPKKAAKKAAKK